MWEGGGKGKWKCEDIWYHAPCCSQHNGSNKIIIPLNNQDKSAGSQVRGIIVFPNMLRGSEREKAKCAMETFDGYRYYSVQAQFEPRVHGLVSSTGSSYVYHGVKMASTPLKDVPIVDELAGKYSELIEILEWGIGVDLVQYKDGEDSIDWHADDNQGETSVLCVIVKLQGTRIVEVRTNSRASEKCDGDEHIILHFEEGDGYVLNEFCQKNYVHRLPKAKDNHSPRWVMVFRDGRKVMNAVDNGYSPNKQLPCLASLRQASHPALSAEESFPPGPFCAIRVTEDNELITRRSDVTGQMHVVWPASDSNFVLATGRQEEEVAFQISLEEQDLDRLTSLTSKDLTYLKKNSPELQGVRYGHPAFSKLIWEGEVIKPRSLLISSGCLIAKQGGVSGNKNCGCDAIVCSGASSYNSDVEYPWPALNDMDAHELMNTLHYSAFANKGALAILYSFERGLPIRVFRSSKLDGILSCPEASGHSGSQSYRYDGLYVVHQAKACWKNKEKESKSKYTQVENLDCVGDPKFRKDRTIQVVFEMKRCPHFDKADVSSSVQRYLQNLPNHLIRLSPNDVYFCMFNSLSTESLLEAAGILPGSNRLTTSPQLSNPIVTEELSGVNPSPPSSDDKSLSALKKTLAHRGSGITAKEVATKQGTVESSSESESKSDSSHTPNEEMKGTDLSTMSNSVAMVKQKGPLTESWLDSGDDPSIESDDCLASSDDSSVEMTELMKLAVVKKDKLDDGDKWMDVNSRVEEKVGQSDNSEKISKSGSKKAHQDIPTSSAVRQKEADPIPNNKAKPKAIKMALNGVQQGNIEVFSYRNKNVWKPSEKGVKGTELLGNVNVGGWDDDEDEDVKLRASSSNITQSGTRSAVLEQMHKRERKRQKSLHLDRWDAKLDEGKVCQENLSNVFHMDIILFLFAKDSLFIQYFVATT